MKWICSKAFSLFKNHLISQFTQLYDQGKLIREADAVQKNLGVAEKGIICPVVDNHIIPGDVRKELLEELVIRHPHHWRALGENTVLQQNGIL